MLEILSPAGNRECAEAAIANGANAIYIGLGSFSARQGAENFDDVSFQELVQSAHFRGVKVYVAMNTIVKDSEVNSFLSTLVKVWNQGADAIIMQDIFLGKYVHSRYPDILLHLSTQAGVCTLAGAKLAKEYGFSRVILARETPLKEIAEIARYIETEVFVQGALCTAFSGQCYFSSFVGGNSGNRGRCKQPCRKLYTYDRTGKEESNYALSLSDLCVGEEIEKLVTAGVLSFKIEGRMRRAEYVGAAVRYYRAVLDGAEKTERELSDLKRAYNRGNYTRGLAFGQDKRLLSTAVQGHIGEKVGVVKVVGGKFLVESAFKPRAGDGFKILRGGREIGGASYVKTEGKSFVVQSKTRLKNGDGVFVTTDTSVNERVLSASKIGKLTLSLSFEEGELPVASCGALVVYGEKPLQSAQTRPLTEEEIKSCFAKTDGLPVEVHFDEVKVRGNIFIPKSELNAFRRYFYQSLCAQVQRNGNTQYEYSPSPIPAFTGENAKTAIISTDFTGIRTDIAVYKAEDLGADLPESFTKGDFEKYVYLPPFTTSEDLTAIARLCGQGIDGVYAENYAGVEFAKQYGVKLFAGTGFHILNARTLATLLEEPCLSYYALSKEGTAEEMKSLVGERGFALSFGDIKLMDFCYCPFGKTCAVCDKKERYGLTDENGRVFPVRRYRSSTGECRFEVYNCASLIGTGVKGLGRLLDLSVTENKRLAAQAKDEEEKQKKVYDGYTSGHYKRGVL